LFVPIIFEEIEALYKNKNCSKFVILEGIPFGNIARPTLSVPSPSFE